MIFNQLKISTNQAGKVTVKPVVSLFSTTALMLVAYVAMSENQQNLQAKQCDCSNDVTYNSSLPSSHPTNRCAIDSDNVSWGDWVTGNSRSSQFHFLDLLELLHSNDKSKPINDIPTNNPNAI
ncbi:hypothetical protein [Shewanella donghaensis]|uniref:hypothetical protein n=1 Tax=Shewanella donghaensis TaxID=238836 RepID=UPI00118299A9|nr:hypothetical protein [Shewanella donghaensis]